MELIILDLNNQNNPLFQNIECQNLFEIYKDYYTKVGYHLPWVGYFIKRENEIVGCCGFVSEPMHNKVEIAYHTFQAFEGQGIASFGCKELVEIAKKTDNSLIICAKTAPESNASTRILTKNGFVFNGIVQDHEIGDAWEWILKS